MTVLFPKSLDRPVDIFGVRGRWIVILLVLIGAGIVAGIFIGVFYGTGVGICSALVGAVAAVFFCVFAQNVVSHRQVGKVMPSMLIPDVVTRRETLSRILLPDTGQRSWFAAVAERELGRKEGEPSDRSPQA